MRGHLRISSCRILLAIGALGAPTLAVAGPWVDPRPGHGYVSLSYNLYQADQYYSGPGEVDALSAPLPKGTKRDISVPIGSGFGTVLQKSNYTDKSMFLYGEVSLYGGLGFTLAMPVLRGISQALDGGQTLSNFGVGDLNVGLKYMVPTVKALRIDIDHERQARRVAEVVETEYFRALRSQTNDLRRIVDKG